MALDIHVIYFKIFYILILEFSFKTEIINGKQFDSLHGKPYFWTSENTT